MRAPSAAAVSQLISVRATHLTRHIVIHCPHCGGQHHHGLPWGRDGPTHRVGHCAPTGRQWAAGQSRAVGAPIGYWIEDVPAFGFRITSFGPTGYTKTTSAALVTSEAAGFEAARMTLRHPRHRVIVVKVDLSIRPRR